MPLQLTQCIHINILQSLISWILKFNSHDGLSFKTVAVIHVTVVYIKIYMVAAIYSTKVNVYNEV